MYTYQDSLPAVVSHVAKKNSLRYVYQESIIRVRIAYKKLMTKLTFPQIESFPYHSYKLLIIPLVLTQKVADSVQPVPRYDNFEMYSPRVSFLRLFLFSQPCSHDYKVAKALITITYYLKTLKNCA